MKTSWMRFLSLCLVAVIFCGSIPNAFAAEPDTAPASVTTPVEESAAIDTESTEDTSPVGESTAESEEVLPLNDEEVLNLLTSSGFALARDSNPEGYVYKNGLIWTSDTSKEFNVTFNGVTQKVEKLNTYAVKYNGVYVPCYCIAPGIPYATDGGYTANEWTTQHAWDSLSESQRQAIGLALIYGYPNGISPSTALDKKGAHGATQMIIWEICYGMRQSTHPYACTDSRFIELFNSDSVGNTFTDGATGSGNGTIYNLNACYNEISASMAAHSVVPSFAATDSAFAQTYEMASNGNGTYSMTLTDANNVLSDCTFTNTSDLTFSKSGNKLTITAKKAITNVTVTASKNVPNVNAQTFIIWTYDKKQTMAQPLSPTNDPTPIYFKLKVSSGSVLLKKTTNTGANLSGWKIGLYTDAACTKAVSGSPFTTGTDGTVTVSSLAAGTYYAKEQAVSDRYWACDLSVKTVQVEAGKTATVTFSNTYYGDLRVKKTAVNGSPERWNFQILDASKKLLATITTGSDGYAYSALLLPGAYYVREVHDRDETYWTYDANVEQKVTVTAGTQAQVAFTNTQYGKIRIVKAMDTDGPLAGWQFKITDAAGTEIGGSPFTSAADGTIVTGKLLPGTYTVEEIIPEDSLYDCKSENPQTITVSSGQTAEVKFTNALRPGRISIQKVDIQGQPLAGASFRLEWSDDGVTWQAVAYSDKVDVVKGGCGNADVTDGCLASGEDGVVEWNNLYPSIRYRITEVEAPAGYQLLKEPAFEGDISGEDDLTVELTVVNSPVFELPMTGSTGSGWLTGFQIAGAISMLSMLLYFAKKRR